MKKLLIGLLMLLSASFMFADTIITQDNAEECIKKFWQSGTYVEKIDSAYYPTLKRSMIEKAFYPKGQIQAISIREVLLDFYVFIADDDKDKSDNFYCYLDGKDDIVTLDSNNNIIITEIDEE